MPFDPQTGLPFDPEKDLHFVEEGGEQRFLACLPPTGDFGGLPMFSAAVSPVIPRSQWQDIDFSGYAAPVLDQGSHGSCVGHGAVTAFWRDWLIQGGTHHDFSACWIYGQINGGWDRGAVITDSLDCLMRKGVALLSEVPEGMIYKKNFPASAAVTALRFRLGKSAYARNFDEIATGLLCGWLPVVGIRVGNNFNNFDKYGVAGVSKGQGNHCVALTGLKKLPDGRWAFICQNSWGTRWGNHGFCYLVEGHFGSSNSPDHYLVRSALEDPNEQRVPPNVA